MAELFSIAAFNQSQPAEQLTERLREVGFDAQVLDESLAQKWHVWQLTPHAQFQVRVPDVDFQAALEQLKQWESSEPSLQQAVHCPECQSTLIEYPQFSRRTWMGALPALAATAGIIERDYYCQNCHFTWPADPVKPEPELDELNWPKSWHF